MTRLTLTLPWPPSVNDYWGRRPRGGVFVKAPGVAFRRMAVAICREAYGNTKPISGFVAVRIRAYPPDKRRRDLDNVLKAALDGLVHGGVLEDDSDIHDLRIVRQGVRDGGELEIEVEAMNGTD